jgi:Bacterial extracellular solute-binding protein, family 7
LLFRDLAKTASSLSNLAGGLSVPLFCGERQAIGGDLVVLDENGALDNRQGGREASGRREERARGPRPALMPDLRRHRLLPRREAGTMTRKPLMPSRPIEIRLGGYGPPTTSFSRALKLIGDRPNAELGDRVEIRHVWNIMDFGYRSEDILWLVESGVLTLGYQSTSYFTDRVPELGLLDLPFLFATRDGVRAAMDGKLGEVLAQKVEGRLNHRILGYGAPVRGSHRHADPRAPQ